MPMAGEAELELAPSAAAPSAGQSKEESDGPADGAHHAGFTRSGRVDGPIREGVGEGHAAEDSQLDRGEQRQVSSALTHEQRCAIAQEIHDTEWNRQWFAGDTGNLWIEQLGESAEQYLSDFGYVHESLANILRVCAAIPPPYRNGNLRFSHHVVVAGENLEDVEMHLAECEEEQWSAAEFRRQRKGTKPRVKRYSVEELRAALKDWYVEDAGTPAGIRMTVLARFLDYLEEEA